jgi:predicted nucleic acid-binding protein
MMPRVFVDANVPMYAAGSEHPLKSPCLRVLEAAARGQIAAVTDAEALQEIMHRYASLDLREQGAEVFELFLRVLLDVLPVTREDMVQALALYRAHPQVQARDVVHAAVMRNHEVTAIVTADRHFDQFVGLRRVDPLDFERFLKESH